MSINIDTVKQAIGISEFTKTKLLEIALTHSSHIYEDSNLIRQQQDRQEREYRRLAILGDSIFGAVTIDYLYQQDSYLDQGEITKLKSAIVSRKKMSEFAEQLKLRQLCQLGGSEKDKSESEQVDLFGEMFEALVGAIYLEFDRDFCRTSDWLVDRFIEDAVNQQLAVTQLAQGYLSEDNLQAVSAMPADEAIEFIKQMKQEVDALVDEDEALQSLLIWINNKYRSLEPSYNSVKVRAFYLAQIRVLGLAFASNFDPTRSASDARQFANSFNRASELALDLAFNLNPKLDPANILASIFALDIEPAIKQELQALQAELPDPKQDKEGFEKWRQANGQAWFEKIRIAIDHDLQFNDTQRESLKKYYEASRTLVEYIKAANLNPQVRDEIFQTLFLPQRSQ